METAGDLLAGQGNLPFNWSVILNKKPQTGHLVCGASYGFFRQFPVSVDYLGLVPGHSGGFPGPSLQITSVEVKDLLPAINRCFLSVARPVNREETVSRTIVAMELVVLAEFLKFGFGGVYIGRGWSRIVVTKQAQHWTANILGVIEGLDRLSLGQVRCRAHYAAAPAVNRGVDAGERTRGQEDLASARAKANDAHLAIVVGQGI